MGKQDAGNLTIIAFGGLFLIAGLVLTIRMWRTGRRWPAPDVHAKAAEIEGAASLRFGVAGVLTGVFLVACGAFLAYAPTVDQNGAAGGAVIVFLVEAVVADLWIMRSGMKLSDRASNVRVRDKMPKRPMLYLVWPPPEQDGDNASPN